MSGKLYTAFIPHSLSWILQFCHKWDFKKEVSELCTEPLTFKRLVNGAPTHYVLVKKGFMTNVLTDLKYLRFNKNSKLASIAMAVDD